MKIWDDLTYEFKPLADEVGLLDRYAGGIPTRVREACNEARANRIAGYREDNWDDRCRALCRG